MSYNTVKVKKYSDIVEEYTAAAAITPGMLLELTSASKVQKHSTAGGNMIPMFALEDELQGNGIDDAYAADDQVQVWVAGRGDMVYALLKDGEDVSVGDYLESAGDGYLKKHTTGTAANSNAIVGQALEALDLSGSSGADPSSQRLLIRVV